MLYRVRPSITVNAFIIEEVRLEEGQDGITLTVRDTETGHTMRKLATLDMVSWMMPRVGDYWVVTSDGYAYLNPGDVFESKYEPIDDV